MGLTRAIPLSITCLGLLLQACSGCDEEHDDEKLILELIERGARQAEKHRVGKVIGLTTKDFVLEPQQLDRDAAKGYLFMAVRRYQSFTVNYPRPAVDVDPSRTVASARFPFLIVRKGSAVPDLKELYENPESWVSKVAGIADLYYMKLWLVKEDDTWLVRKAHVDGYRGLDKI